ncbi:hypothetical protein C3747_14g205 [Trypanosoma cruzi]|uniref:Uncharacterized protein n=2 Tax=Trypanosoma cruzi TaxID=5693 RepID=Q4DZA7_TRYCC|nr:hypothetical protein, conserved [Trypanosoma cruzi]7AOR_b Chain b, bS6m [Trypanosoma cruzi strain CL Brener]PBJ72540.1 hypothetical protein BCY84_15391 [Trypanosoma cruzi cruzi]EAN97842.1 hypothetical protein, conserved [Trypanosoma cruzi]KAF8276447.1 mitochondrial ribosomal protein s6 [Trypanosoma cruzi]KAF8293062.1 mitochondrial ribosomal protein s6 [Trypanosoma cruzi]PWU90886.1 hypothetical protein C4B63_47g58 [Trypanosoma cruzi]|eukprot:XP_819693.1 hypothetical protein [Trypanosoma cruzi strain CL Brener]
MVFYAFVLVMKPRQRRFTSQALREIAVAIYNNGGLIRKLSNEGVMRPYSRFRDADNTPLTYARYVTLQVDMGEEQMRKVEKIMKEHQDVFITLNLNNLERPVGIRRGRKDLQSAYFPLDTFTRLEEEINWPPQTSADIYKQLEMNWKEFSRTRWSNFLRN